LRVEIAAGGGAGGSTSGAGGSISPGHFLRCRGGDAALAPRSPPGARSSPRGRLAAIDHRFPFEQVPDALRLMHSGKHFGKICIDL
jgi:hypothetical protein